MTRTADGQATTLADQFTYRADGLMTGKTLGNGLVDSRSHDLQGRLATQSVGAGEDRVYSYDASGNVTAMDTAAEDRTFSYDALDRLVQDAAGGNEVTDYGYDPNGNRVAENATVYTYEPAANRLASVGGEAVILDAAGHITALRDLTLSYNQAGRVDSVTRTTTSGGGGNGGGGGGGTSTETVDYVYDTRGLRTRKIAASGTTIYHYDLQGRLIAETTDTGEPIASYVWVGTEPLAQTRLVTTTVTTGHGKNQTTTTITEEVFAYLHADHLDTPRLASDETGTVVWRWDGNGFGSLLPNEDPDGDGTALPVHLRFPGQYYDTESGLHYNWNRYYSPDTGRYITSDPIGLYGGINTYSYALSNPLRFADETGLDVWEDQPLPDIPLYPWPSTGPGCTYYDGRCVEDGGEYYCRLAPQLCSSWPTGDGPIVDCVRKCLQSEDVLSCDETPSQCSDEGVDIPCNFDIHLYCWWSCYTDSSRY